MGISGLGGMKALEGRGRESMRVESCGRGQQMERKILIHKCREKEGRQRNQEDLDENGREKEEKESTKGRETREKY